MNWLDSFFSDILQYLLLFQEKHSFELRLTALYLLLVEVGTDNILSCAFFADVLCLV